MICIVSGQAISILLKVSIRVAPGILSGLVMKKVLTCFRFRLPHFHRLMTAMGLDGIYFTCENDHKYRADVCMMLLFRRSSSSSSSNSNSNNSSSAR